MNQQSGETFPGFERRSRVTPVPERFFTELLPEISSHAELKLTLYAFWALSQQHNQYPYLSRENLLNDEILLQMLAGPDQEPLQALEDALQLAVSRGTLLHIRMEEAGTEQHYYLLNSSRGRQAAAAIEKGTWRPAFEPQPLLPIQTRPNIYLLYEQNIGPLTPMIADHLKDAEIEYHPQWIEEAFRIAVVNNVRKWSYIEAILKDWQDRGKDGRGHHQRTGKAEGDYAKGWFND